MNKTQWPTLRADLHKRIDDMKGMSEEIRVLQRDIKRCKIQERLESGTED